MEPHLTDCSARIGIHEQTPFCSSDYHLHYAQSMGYNLGELSAHLNYLYNLVLCI